MANQRAFLTLFPTEDIDSRVIRQSPTIAFQVTAFGIPDLDRKSVTWMGNHLAAKTTHGASIEGNLIQKNGLPFRLQFQVDGQNWNNSVDYGYGETLEYPSHFTSSIMVIGTNLKSPILNTTILTFKKSLVPLPNILFDPEAIIASTSLRTLVKSNGMVFMKQENGSLLAPTNNKKIVRAHPFPLLPVLFVVGCFGIFMQIALKSRRRGKKEYYGRVGCDDSV